MTCWIAKIRPVNLRRNFVVSISQAQLKTVTKDLASHRLSYSAVFNFTKGIGCLLYMLNLALRIAIGFYIYIINIHEMSINITMHKTINPCRYSYTHNGNVLDLKHA
jgi:hypothetical protein